MCPPTYYRVAYILNPWMVPTEWHQSNYVQAQHQWGNLVELLKSMGCEIELATPDRRFPDLCFTANAGYYDTRDQTRTDEQKKTYAPPRLVLSYFRHPERRGEVQHFRKYGYISIIPDKEDDFWEGAGDVLWDAFREINWSGYGFRSSLKGITNYGATKIISEYNPQHGGEFSVINTYPHALELVDPRFYHLDCTFCTLTDGEIMYYPGGFSKEALDKIEAEVLPKYRIEVTEEEARMFCCNAIVLGHKIIMSSVTSRLKEKLAQYSYEVIECNLSQFHKAGGSAACLVLRLLE